MKKKQGIALFAAVLMAGALLSGCGGTAKDTSSAVSSEAATTTTTAAAVKTDVNVYGIKGPTGIGMVNLMAANDRGTASNKYNFTVVSAPDDIVAKISSSDADIAAVPTNLAATLYKKTSGNVKMLAVNTLGVLYILENGKTISSVADLKGKTIYATGKGANPEYVLDYVLKSNGINPDKDVNIVYKTENDELAALLVSNKASVALVPEPVVTTVLMKNTKLRVALDMTKEWNTVSGGKSKLMMGCVIARKAFIDEHPDAVNAFLTEYKASIDKSTSDIAGTATLCEKYGIIPKSTLAKQAIPRCSLTYVAGNDMMSQIKGYFDVLYAASPKSLGGALPDDTFYYNAQG